MGGPFADLELTEAQQSQLRAKLDAEGPKTTDREAMKAKFESMKKDKEAKLQSFKQDGFDAAAFVTPPAGREKSGPRAHGDRMLNHLAVLVPILTLEQREKLAQKIEQGPPARPQRH